MALNSWICVFTKRDQSKALDFIQTMKKVTPAMGIGVRNSLKYIYKFAWLALQTVCSTESDKKGYSVIA